MLDLESVEVPDDDVGLAQINSKFSRNAFEFGLSAALKI